MADFFYDNQIRKFLIQFGKIFSNWQCTRGTDPNGNPILVRIPIKYGDASRQASTVMANNSSSTLPSAPLLSYYITGLEYDQRRTQEPFFTEKLTIRQRAVDQQTGDMTTTQGQAFTVERMMPVPYTLRIQVDFWSTNSQQKLEFVEQLGPLFNPSMEIQSNQSFLDWTSLSVVYQDGITYSSRSIPQGTGNPIDVFSWKFYMPIWISPPAKLRKMGVIQKIITSIHEGTNIDDMYDEDILMGTRQKVTPYGYNVLFVGNSLQLIPANQPFNPRNSEEELPEYQNTDIYWSSLLNVYGTVVPGISQIWLENPFMETFIVGTIVPDPLDDRLLIFNVDQDTLPANTMAPVDSIVDPLVSGPGAGLPAAENGTRYLLTNHVGSVGSSTAAWGSVVANANDIIQYNSISGEWEVVFNSSEADMFEFVTNLTTGVQYRFANGEWAKSVEGWYPAGNWSVVI